MAISSRRMPICFANAPERDQVGRQFIQVAARLITAALWCACEGALWHRELHARTGGSMVAALGCAKTRDPGRVTPSPDSAACMRTRIMSGKPLGIVLTAAYSAITAVFCVLLSFLGFFGAGLVQPAVAGWVSLLSFVGLALGIVAAAVAYGLWTRQPWAPNLTLYTFWVWVVLGVVAMFYDRTPGNMLLQIVGIVISLAVIRYVRQPEVAALFLDRQVDGASPKL
jgi:hypothetical protein